MAKKLEDRLSDMAARMTMREPFIAGMFSTLPRFVEEKGSRYTTAATNGAWFRFNREFCDALDNEQLFGLCLHEAMHVIFMHMWRREGRCPFTWNVSNDGIINCIIRSQGYALPDGGVHIAWVTPQMSSEEVYARMYKEMEDEAGKGDGEGEGGEDGDGEGDGDGNGDDKSHGIKGRQHRKYGQGGFDGHGDLEDAPSEASGIDMEATIKAMAKMAKACGDGSLVVERVLGGDLQPQVKWTDVTRTMLISASRNDFTYAKINRRHAGGGVYLPALHSENMGGLGVGYDTSGSMGEAECNAAAAELRAIITDCRPDWVEVAYCDTKISSVQRFNQDEPFQLKPTGGGGTEFKPVFDYFIDKGERLAGLIYFTDLEGDLMACPDPQCPVIWAYTGSRDPDQFQVPFGTIVRVQV